MARKSTEFRGHGEMRGQAGAGGEASEAIRRNREKSEWASLEPVGEHFLSILRNTALPSRKRRRLRRTYWFLEAHSRLFRFRSTVLLMLPLRPPTPTLTLARMSAPMSVEIMTCHFACFRLYFLCFGHWAPRNRSLEPCQDGNVAALRGSFYVTWIHLVPKFFIIKFNARGPGRLSGASFFICFMRGFRSTAGKGSA